MLPRLQRFLLDARSLFSDYLGVKFILIIAAILATTMLIATIVIYQYENRIYSNYVQKKHVTLGYLTAEMSTEAMLSFDYSTLDKYIKTLSQEEDIVYAAIKAKDGTYLTSYLDYTEKAIADIIFEKHKDDYVFLVKQLAHHPGVINFTSPITYYQSELGTLHIGISKENVEAFAKKNLNRQLIAVVIIISLLSIAIFVVFRISTLRPLQQLMSGLQHVARGDLNYSLSIQRKDEIGRLTGSFNAMVGTLRTTHHEKDHALQQLQQANIGLQTDVQVHTNKLDEANEELKFLALYDSLTKLPNRYHMIGNIQSSIDLATQNNEKFGVIMMDLDRFKEINDTLGHNVGDELLIKFGERLSATLRADDFVGRLGGDEFALVVKHVDSKRLLRVAKNIFENMDPEFIIQDRPLFITCSLGLSIFPDHGVDPDSLLRCADIAMYEAKTSKQGVSLYNPDFETANVKHLDLLGGLRTAIYENELFLEYQPKVDLLSGKVSGVEALVRWKHRERGIIPPDEFISLAENSGLINPLTHWVLNEAIRQNSLWYQQGYELSVAVNLSMFNLHDLSLPTYIHDLLVKYNLPSSSLVLEVTETAIMTHPDMVLKVLNSLKETGITISVDDFGTGYSSLSQLRKLPVSEMKIDRSFVMNMANEGEDQLIVTSIVNLGHNLGLRVVAEGVEDVESVVLLSHFGCDYVQGYYYSKPISAKEITWFCSQPCKSVAASSH